MLDNILEAVLALVTLAALVWGALGRREAARRGAQGAVDSIGQKIEEADRVTREKIRHQLELDPDRDDARERLRARLADARERRRARPSVD